MAKEVKAMPNTNIFREAKRLLDTKKASEMNEEELLIINAATIPHNLPPEFNDRTIDEGLEELAKIGGAKE